MWRLGGEIGQFSDNGCDRTPLGLYLWIRSFVAAPHNLLSSE